jgi:hypothetical protein
MEMQAKHYGQNSTAMEQRAAIPISHSYEY